MTRNAVPPRVVHTGNDSAQSFSVASNGEPIYFRSNADVNVVTLDADGVETILIEGHDYELTGGPTDGLVTLPYALESGKRLSIRRETALSQETDFELAADWNSSRAIVTDTFDRVIEIIQEIEDRIEPRFALNTFETAWNADGKQIGNLADGTASDHAVTYGQLQQVIVDAITAFNIAGLDTLGLVDDNADYLIVRDSSAAAHKKALSKNLGFTPSGTGASLRSIQSKLRDVVSIKDFGATGDGVTDDTVAIQAAITAVGNAGGGTLYFPPGTYLFSSAIIMAALVRLVGDYGCVTLKHKNSSNLETLIDFDAASADGASMFGLIIDGNKDNNTSTLPTERFAVYINNADDVSVEQCEIKEYAGHGIFVRDGMRPIIRFNYIHDLYFFGVYILRTTLGAYNNPIISDNYLAYCSWHTIAIHRCVNARIERNNLECTRVTGQVVSVSGAIVTWLSGNNFADVQPGNFIVYNGGTEALIISKESSTQVTLSSSPGNTASAPSGMGAADNISVGGCTNTWIKDNNVIGGISLGISVFGSDTYGSDIGARVIDNYVESIGSAGLSIQTSGAGTVRDNLWCGNKVVEAGLNTTGSSTVFNSGMTVQGAATDIVVDGNTWLSYGSAMYGLNIITTGAQVRTANNQSNTSSLAIENGASVVLTSGWGAGATVTEVEAYDDCVSFLITTTASAPSASAVITVTHRNIPIRKKRATFKMATTSANILQIATNYPDLETTSVGVISGTPSASSTYRIILRM